MPDSLRRLKAVVPVSCIVDVGVRECTEDLIGVFPTYKHYLFEPVDVYFDEIQRRYETIDHELHAVALAAKTSEFYLVLISRPKDGTVTHAELSPHAVEVDGIEFMACRPIAGRRFDSLDLASRIPDDFLLKVDIDGQDLDAVKGFGEHLQRASMVIIEFAMWNIVEHLGFLQSAVFVLVDLVDPIYYGHSLYQLDAIFVREDRADAVLRPDIRDFDEALWAPFSLTWVRRHLSG